MKNIPQFSLKRVCLLLTAFLFLSQAGQAMFRFHKSPVVAKSESPRAQQHLQRLQHLTERLSFLPQHGHRKHSNPEDRYNSAGEGMVSFISSIFSLVCLAALGITSFELFIIPAFILGIMATVFGIIGLKRRRPGFAIAGLTLGLLEIVAGIVLLAVVSWL